MHNLSQEILARYQVRKKKAQKAAFRAFLREGLEAQGYAVKEERTSTFSGTNIIVGDPAKAEVIFTAHYDTCAVMPLPNLIAPKNILVSVLCQMLIVVLMLAVAVGAGLLAIWLTRDLSFGLIVYAIVLLLELYSLMFGPANKHTANDNTSGVIVLVEALLALPEALRGKAAFVFFDHEEYGLLGSAAFKKKHIRVINGKPVINFDCVSDGDHILLTASKALRRDAAWMARMQGALAIPEGKTAEICPAYRVLYPSDQMNFPKAAGVVALRRAPLVGYYLGRIHTPRDTVFDERNIGMLSEMITRMVTEGEGSFSCMSSENPVQ